MAQFRYFKIQHKTIDLSARLRGINYRVSGVYSPEPRDVYGFTLNFKISKLDYFALKLPKVLVFLFCFSVVRMWDIHYMLFTECQVIFLEISCYFFCCLLSMCKTIIS